MPVQIHSPIPLLVAAVVGVVALVLLLRRPLTGKTRVLLAIAVALIALAAGDLHALLPRRGDVVVMIDLSPSTRGAMYRDRSHLDARLKQILGSRRYRLVAFAEKQVPLPTGETFSDLPAALTMFDPPTADAIVLFSDGRFDLPPAAPPTYAVIDGGLVDSLDAAVTDVRVDDDGTDVVVTGRGPQRVLGLTGSSPITITPNDTTLHRFRPDTSPTMGRAELSRADAWPENDALTFTAPQAPERQRWWIGTNPPAGWTVIDSASISPEDFLQPSVIALHDVSAGDVPPATQDRLQQYVRDLGGSLMLLGGDHSFAAGGYSGTTLDAISPLASDPPTPTTHWMLLTDASGSMATGRRWQSAATAIAAVMGELPGADLVSVGSFAADLRWWTNGVSVRDAIAKPVPPADVSPSGPTNLQPVLQKLVETAPADLQKQLLLLTDGETSLDVDPLVEPMRTKKLRLHVLAIGNGSALPALQRLAAATSGSYAVELNAAEWLGSVRKLLRAARGESIVRQTVAVDFTSALMLQSRMTSWFNRTWLKPGATAIAHAPGAPLAAIWPVGNGQVAAAAFDLQPAELAAFTARIARPPRDPRFRVDWHAHRVMVDAADGDRPLNELALTLQLRGLNGGSRDMDFTQIGPGRYEVPLPTVPQPRLAVLRLNGREVDRRTLPGRYAREFAGIGVDEGALRKLAERTGGRVIGPADVGVPLPRIWRATALSPWLAAIGAAVLLGGLIHWKRS